MSHARYCRTRFGGACSCDVYRPWTAERHAKFRATIARRPPPPPPFKVYRKPREKKLSWLVPFPLYFVHQWIIVARGHVKGVTATESKAEEIRRAADPRAVKTLIA